MNTRRAEYLDMMGRHEEARAERERRNARCFPPVRKFPARVQRIFDECAARYEITVAEMLHGPQTKRATNAKRQAAHRLAELGFSLNEMGRFLNRHHTSVMYLLKGKRPPGSDRKPPMPYIPSEDYSGEWAI